MTTYPVERLAIELERRGVRVTEWNDGSTLKTRIRPWITFHANDVHLVGKILIGADIEYDREWIIRPLNPPSHFQLTPWFAFGTLPLMHYNAGLIAEAISKLPK